MKRQTKRQLEMEVTDLWRQRKETIAFSMERDNKLERLAKDMETRSRSARAKARKEFARANFGQHRKYSAVARVWKMAANQIYDLLVPF